MHTVNVTVNLTMTLKSGAALKTNLWGQVEDALRPRGGKAPGLLDEKGDGEALIEES